MIYDNKKQKFGVMTQLCENGSVVCNLKNNISNI